MQLTCVAACWHRLLCCRFAGCAICRDDRSVILLAQPFGYGSKGHITITLKKLSLYRRHDQADQGFSLKNLGIILSDTESQGKLETYLRSGKCPLQDAELRIFNFDTKEIQNVLTGEKDAAQLDIDVKNGGLASLFFINCEAGMPASFAAKVEQYNLIGDPERRDYLAIGETELDVMYWVSVLAVSQMGAAVSHTAATTARDAAVAAAASATRAAVLTTAQCCTVLWQCALQATW